MLSIKKYEPKYAQRMREMFPNRARLRWEAYVNPRELVRVTRKLESKNDAMVRLGVFKPGKGFMGRERADFCLAGAGISGRKLTLLYRSLELAVGLAHDLALVDMLSEALEIEWGSLTILAAHANLRSVNWPHNQRVHAMLLEEI